MNQEEIVVEIERIKGVQTAQGQDIASLKEKARKIEEKQELMYEMNKNIALMAQSQQRTEESMGEMKAGFKTLSNEIQEIKNAPATEMYSDMKKIKFNMVSAISVIVATGMFGALVAVLASK